MSVMGVELLPVIGYALVSIFTPGPNNITSSSLGMRVGYLRTLHFIAGVVTGFFCIMVATGLLTELLVLAYDRIAIVLKSAGVAYLLWIAWTVVRPQDQKHASPARAAPGNRDGCCYQSSTPRYPCSGSRWYPTLLASMAKNGRKSRPFCSVARCAEFLFDLTVGTAWCRHPAFHCQPESQVCLLAGPRRTPALRCLVDRRVMKCRHCKPYWCQAQ